MLYHLSEPHIGYTRLDTQRDICTVGAKDGDPSKDYISICSSSKVCLASPTVSYQWLIGEMLRASFSTNCSTVCTVIFLEQVLT